MQTFRLTSLLGLKVRIDLCWMIIFALILWTFTAIVFPYQFPHLSPSTHLGMSVMQTLLFMASVFAHQLSQALVVRAKGIPVSGINLLIFGRIWRSRPYTENPQDELQIAGGGLITLVAIVLLYAFLGWWGNRAGWSVAVTGIANALAWMNGMLTMFKVLPGFPLDGGRWFRALVWKLTGNWKTATRIASRCGVYLSYGIIAVGVAELIGGYILDSMWSILIGGFLKTAIVQGNRASLNQ
ncbi:hypothetical protein [Phormidium sp. CCY1219]|uniref:hypothetical protein n=1 Tax=Phormidium sp. CCY1219 TaxID=2886104 RepID=UPI002D1E96CA|nr:hypothetical protein [Phormidium sp. CCY1219]MEB3827695.1 hypothetical protein [Phormidium sp. CCY1219]